MVPRVVKTDEEWKKELGEKVYKILRARGTEPPFCGNLLDNHQEGIYFCAGCDLPLFSSASKFHSGTGWPSFFQPYAPENIVTQHDTSHGMVRDEILCARCGGHLGHVFPDGPPPTGLRYCLNAAALIFRTKEKFLQKKD
ncbi:MAG: peptide-methionine (R)-S-oxide reductase MsrB [Verrucomicrobia bacterium]|jgi:methionine-R-sulfoxide reductase|nr:MAG: peptide-methionine (R)-S-oxide reductase MsrB [Verrucomicrobiota bacterium]